MFHPSSAVDREAAHRELLDRGYLRIAHFVRESCLRELETEIASLGSATAASNHTVVRDDAGSVIAMHRLDNVSDLLFDLARREEMIGLAAALLGKAAQSLHVSYYAGPAHQTALPARQDHASYYEHFRNELALSICIVLDDIDPLGGAPEYSGAAKRELLAHVASPVIGVDLELATCSPDRFERATVQRGGALIHHSYAIRRTATNLTQRTYRTISFNYRGSPYRERLRREAAAVGGEP
jgi:phytanoyl-CoA dioxygenase PhyH